MNYLMDYLLPYIARVILLPILLYYLFIYFYRGDEKVDSAFLAQVVRNHRISETEKTSLKSASELPIEKIQLPKGFTISVFASGITEARSLARGKRGTIFVGNRHQKKCTL